MLGLWDLQRKHNISWNAKISVISANSQNVCSDQCNVQKYIGDSNVSQLKLSLSAAWGIWDCSNSFTRCEEPVAESYKKTHETLSHAGQKATAAISNVGTAISKKFGDMRSHSIGYSIRHSISMPAMRNSPTFKSFEEKVETTVTSLKTKVGGTSHTGGSFEEVLSSTAHASAQSSLAGTRLPESEEELQC
ncbi:tumor protein D53 isoform X3 [Aquila chrysaetos chrysaetos]|uniref:tumor protein D53 isoform X3 n=1 Tax=Aquila chrysaetos chrysaetos TaxID=223781 RepID=UPI001176A02B|nr:tumor protein D53 isoform X3 [Aquila chrysaetos chrysaetos]